MKFETVEKIVNLIVIAMVVGFVSLVTWTITSSNAEAKLMVSECKETSYVYLKDNTRHIIYDCGKHED